MPIPPTPNPKRAAVAGLFGRNKDSRSFPILDFYVIDDDDERCRREQARLASQKQKEEEEERQRLAEEEAEFRRQEEKRLAEINDTRPRTQDSAGKIIWVIEQDPEELPNIHEFFDTGFATTPNDDLPEIARLSNLPIKRPPLPDAKVEKKEPKKGHKRFMTKSATGLGRTSKLTEEFSDGFYRHEYMQPPLTETMQMRSGVLMECMGVRKSAPAARNDDGRMSRAQYLNMIRRRDQGSSDAGGSISDAGSTDTARRKFSKTRPQSAPVLRPDAAVSMSIPIAPKVVKQTSKDLKEASNAAKDASATAQGDDEDAETPVALANAPCPPSRVPLFMGRTWHPEANQKAPPAPAARLRNKDRSLGGDAQPRNRGTFIGSVNTYNGRSGPIQPPLGAVMGHGLMQIVSQRNEFYFPHFPPSPGHASMAPSSQPSAQIRTSSEPVPASRGHSKR
jgi:hypothetical protein